MVKIMTAPEIIRKHKLLNYVIKNRKCASMYGLSDAELAILEEWSKEPEEGK